MFLIFFDNLSLDVLIKGVLIKKQEWNSLPDGDIYLRSLLLLSWESKVLLQKKLCTKKNG